MDLTTKTDVQIKNLIENHETRKQTHLDFYFRVLEERARRGQEKSRLSIDSSLDLLRAAAIAERCVTYGDLAKASGVPWSQARQRLNGKNGHLDQLLDVCHARSFPLLTALVVNAPGVVDGELEETALEGFAAGARRLGYTVADARAFHQAQRDACWLWGADLGQTEAAPGD